MNLYLEYQINYGIYLISLIYFKNDDVTNVNVMHHFFMIVSTSHFISHGCCSCLSSVLALFLVCFDGMNPRFDCFVSFILLGLRFILLLNFFEIFFYSLFFTYSCFFSCFNVEISSFFDRRLRNLFPSAFVYARYEATIIISHGVQRYNCSIAAYSQN